MNRKWGSEIPISCSERLNGYTGAEIEQLAKDSLFDGLDQAYERLSSIIKNHEGGNRFPKAMGKNQSKARQHTR